MQIDKWPGSFSRFQYILIIHYINCNVNYNVSHITQSSTISYKEIATKFASHVIGKNQTQITSSRNQLRRCCLRRRLNHFALTSLVLKGLWARISWLNQFTLTSLVLEVLWAEISLLNHFTLACLVLKALQIRIPYLKSIYPYMFRA